MCARYFIADDDDMRPLIEEMNRSPLMALIPEGKRVVTEGEVTPGCVSPVLASKRGAGTGIFPMQWGFEGKRLLINARAETAAEKITFRDAWTARRCAVPASWYFEWEHLIRPDGTKKAGSRWRIRPGEEKTTWLCGLYQLTGALPRFVILTREPGEGIRFIHDRMPLILPRHAVDRWVDPHTLPDTLLPLALTDMRCDKDPA